MNRSILTCVLMLLAVSCSSSDSAESNDTEQGSDEEFVAEVSAPYIFSKGQNGYNTYRIPAIVKSSKGTLLAFCEGRKTGGGDSGDIDLVLRRSIDGGKTWSKMIIVWDDVANTCGNPSPVVDPETGRIHLLLTHNLGVDKAAGDFNKPGVTRGTRTVHYTWSDDDGLTWAPVEDITSEAKEENMGWYATGPCHAIIKEYDPHKGRIIVPCDYNTMATDTTSSKGFSHVIYSDDKGASWKIGGNVSGGNESSVAELDDGRLVISCRSGGGVRRFAWSDDAGETFSSPILMNDLPDPRCQGSLLSTVFQDKQILLHSNCADKSSRIKLTVKASLDGGETWNSGHTVWDGPSAYSDMVMLDDNILGVLYENGESSSYERISFDRVRINYIVK